jgi:protein-disulfide isomerase
MNTFKSMIFGLIGAIILMGCQNSDTKGQSQTSEASQSEAKVVMTEYSDFQCPACALFFPMVQKLKKEYGEKLEVEYKYFPLNNHQYALLAARAAEAASNQGKFREMRGMLFENQQKWAGSGNPQPIFVNYAKNMGLDTDQFKDDLNSAESQQAVMKQKNEGIERGVNSTPSFYINGEVVPTLPRDYEQFKALMDIYMNEAKQAAQNN